MTPFLQLALALSIIIVAAKAGGYLSYRLGQPAVLGELLTGLLLGPSLLDLFHTAYFTDPHLGEVVHELAEIGVLLLMFVAGLDLHLADFVRAGRLAALAGTLGVALPLGLGVLTGLLFSLNVPGAIFLGLVLSATSVSISAQTLMELKALRSRVGIGLLGAAVFDDILVILGLSAFTALTKPGAGGGALSVLWILAQMLLFLAGASLIGRFVFPRASRLIHQLPISQGLVAFAFITLLLYGWLAETLGGMAAITGAFLAGLWFSRIPLRERIQAGFSSLAYGVFVPIFFINIGLSADLHTLAQGGLLLMLIMTLVAIFGKVLGAGLGALLGGLSRHEALQLGVGMMSRGEVGLIVASVGVSEGLVGAETFSGVVGMVILTTLLTPPLLRMLFARYPSAPSPAPAVVETARPAPEGS